MRRHDGCVSAGVDEERVDFAAGVEGRVVDGGACWAISSGWYEGKV